jgi:Fic family protein
MRKVVNPPNTDEQLQRVLRMDSKSLHLILQNRSMLDQFGRYRHWDRLRYMKPPEGLSVVDWWLAIKLARQSQYKAVNLFDKDGSPFKLVMFDDIYRSLHQIDSYAGGNIHLNEPVINPSTRDTYLVHSLIEESISSSQLEGASTTRAVAKEMLATQRKPKDKSEQMIYNNYQAMRFIHANKEQDLTPKLIYELHAIVTQDTLDDSKVGVLRSSVDNVVVADAITGEVIHVPPDAALLAARIDELCIFANMEQETVFIHPVVKAIILHFMIGYIHPFVDGNGRTARALFYWYMARKGYWLIEYVSISSILKDAPVKYVRAYLHTETDENDLTYFVIDQLNVLLKAISGLRDYLAAQSKAMREAKALLSNNTRFQQELNSRQLALINHAMKHPNYQYSVRGHQVEHGVSYETARNDLMVLANQLKLLDKLKKGREYVFVAPANLLERIQQ